MRKNVNLKRLEKLIEYMEGLPKEANRHFSMDTFLEHHGDHKHKAPRSKRDLLHSCGTTACAMGWAATMPYFQKLGLSFRKNGRIGGIDVIARLMSYEWQELFGGYNRDRTPKQWAKRARKCLLRYQAEAKAA